MIQYNSDYATTSYSMKNNILCYAMLYDATPYDTMQ